MAQEVIVTGGTGALGRAVVRAFLAQGDRVLVSWLVEAERASIEVEEKEALGSGQLSLIEADVAEASGARSVSSAMPGAAVLVNGVGGFGGGAPVHETDLDLWDRLYRMNVRTAAAMTAAVVPGMIERGAGCIVNVASRAAFDCPGGIAAYSASKSAVAVLTQSLQNEVGEAGIRVNAVVPTTIDTPANRAGMPDADFSQWTPPARIAGVITWLASDAGSTVRGGLIPV